MSHELRTPLNVVLGLSQLLEDTNLDSEQTGYVRSIHRSGRVLLALIEDVLDISKIEAGKVRLDHVPFTINDMALEVIDLFSAQASEKNIRLIMDIDKLADRAVIGDPGRLRQVLVNFVSNALKFTDQGRIVIRIEVEPATATLSAPRFCFAVTDSGIGIKAEDHDKIFQKFSQVQSGNSRRYGGTGLGLVISRHLIELMGGEIGFESDAGRGSCFWFRVNLPVTASPLSAGRGPSAPAGASTRENPMPLTTKKMNVEPTGIKVLAVDDNRESQNVILLLLRRLGHDAKVASSGPEAIQQVLDNDFDVVFMDVQMPGMDGYETTTHLRAMPDGKSQVPIVALTANALSGDADKCISAGMNAYMTKPVRIESLRDAVVKWSKIHRGESNEDSERS